MGKPLENYVMTKNIIIIIFLFVSKLTFGQKDDNPYLKLSVDSIVFYDFGGRPEEEINSIIEKNGKLSKTVIKSAKLDKLTADNFTKLLGQKTSYGSSTAACFEPHLGVVYYLNKKPIAYIDICLSCNRLYPSLKINTQMQGKQGEGKEVYYTLNGISKSFRKEINSLLIKYKFSHQLAPKKLTEKSMFD